MYINEYPDCCCIKIAAGFPFAHGRNGTVAGVNEWLKSIVDDPPYVAWILAVLNDYQEEKLGETLRANKFVRTKRKICPDTNHVIYLYIHKPKIKGVH